MKRKLIIEYWASEGELGVLPVQYSISKERWLVEIMSECSDGTVEEFEVVVKEKVLLQDLLPYVNEQLQSLVPENSVDCGFRLYRCKMVQKRKRK